MVAIYADTGNLKEIAELAKRPDIAGITTNPSLMKAAGIGSYEVFAHKVLEAACGKPVSFEVLADDWAEMEKQARRIAAWGPNVLVKIPITNTQGISSKPLLERLHGIHKNVTAVMLQAQINEVESALEPDDIVSVFQGRIMDAGRMPLDPMRRPCRFLWASARELYNVRQAKELDFDIITLSPALITKLPLRGKDLTKYSLETVRQFYKDSLEIAL